MSNILKIGVIVGGGTGTELADVFVKTAEDWFCELGLEAQFQISPQRYATYFELRELSNNDYQRRCEEEVSQLHDDLLSMASKGSVAVFRTAIHAQILYAVRGKTQAIKPILHLMPNGHTLLMMRDQCQGFYNSCLKQEHSNYLSATSSFSKSLMYRLWEYSVSYAKDQLKGSYDKWATYKHHVLGNSIHKWFEEIDPEVKCIQPNDATSRLLVNPSNSDILMLAGNEVGDILDEILGYSFSRLSRTELGSYDILLAEGFNELRVYQTMHGSADELTGKNVVDPTATLDALAKVISQHLQRPELAGLFMQASKQTRTKKTSNLDQQAKRHL